MIRTSLLLAGMLLAGVPAASTAQDASADTAAALPFFVFEGDTLFLIPTIEVVGSRVPAALPGVVRGVEMLTADELERQPGRSAAELLQTIPSVVTGQRQQFGVQSDLSIRGSTYEQVQLLLDGYDLADPQTGHHLMNLPLGRHDMERLEVLPGHGSALYGSGAFGGVVNVVSKRPGRSTGGEMGATGGANGTYGGWGSLDLVDPDLGATSARLSLEGFHTDGHDLELDDGTVLAGANDADLWSGTVRLHHEKTDDEMDIFAGYADRQFGAPDFYAPTPSWEHTRTFFTAARWNRRVREGFNLEPRVAFRRHQDQFVLFRDDPDRYTNDHVTRRFSGELRGIATLGETHSVAMGVEGVYEDIRSTGVRGGSPAAALGEHLRRRLSVSAELDRHGAPLRWQLGARLDERSVHKARLSGTGAISYDVAQVWTLRASTGTVYRVPTFTDLHYRDPANEGDPNLSPEEGWTWDTGVELNTTDWHGRAVYFERYEENVIDWTMAPGESVWRATNVTDGTVRGVETRLAWRHPRGHSLGTGWTWLEKTTSLPDDYAAKYALLVPRHSLVGTGTLVLPANLALTATGRYLARTGGPDDFRHAFVLDAHLDWRHRAGWFISTAGTNLLDRRVMEVPGVPLAGTLMTASAGKRF
ncbi:MAG: TonB-dependent receptor [bacterium]|nr:TonB-dependent receptor [bacterium]